MKKLITDWKAIAEMVEDTRVLTYDMERAAEEKDQGRLEDLRDELAGVVDQMYHMFNDE